MSTMTNELELNLARIKLPWVRDHYQELAKHAVSKALGHVDYLAMLIDGEAQQRNERAVQRRIRQARFPYLRSLQQFQFSHPAKIDQPKIRNLFALAFVKEKANVIFVGSCGMGKTHLAIALGYHACVAGFRVLFTTAIDMVNALATAHSAHQLDHKLRHYCKPEILIIDELGYLPVDRHGADLLFQVISARYERASTVVTTNRTFKHWPKIFDNDAVLTSAVLDRLRHHHELVVIEGQSYRMKKHRD